MRYAVVERVAPLAGGCTLVPTRRRTTRRRHRRRAVHWEAVGGRGDIGVITSDKAFDLLVEACPSYWAADQLDAYVAAFEDVGEPDLYVRISAFSHHLVDLMTGSDLSEVRAVFATVERLLTEGDAEAIELVE